MQTIYFDISAGALKRNPELTDWLEHGQAQTGVLRQRGYNRLLLQAEKRSELYDLLETVIFQESMHWILQEEGNYYRHLLEPEAYEDFQQQAKRRIERMEPAAARGNSPRFGAHAARDRLLECKRLSAFFR